MTSTRFGGFEAIVFDAYGTIFDLGALEGICAAVAPDPAAFSRMWRVKQLEYATLRTVLDRYSDWGQITSDALDYTTTIFGLSIDPTQRGRLMRGWIELPAFPDAAPALRRLDESGDRIAVLSNATHDMLDPLIARNGLAGVFDDVLTSEMVQVFKPDRHLYAVAADRFMARPNEVLFVTTNGFDVAGAKAAGLTVCWVDRHGLPLDPLGFDPDIRVHTLVELADLLLGGPDEPVGLR
ncbi:MAG TPA: haloacid dehalogenase type II [Thermomicrobiales bacterium]|jgi:2-haloacid dehalogenase|nr:haloacid dehalogenase type II [Chloroflexota bacterium]HQX62677.1 haloacid dehalogenase type II [Thermomicrobiales bacterium]HQZ90413.1 haloacid dehalogenase type II [Thermomicrobiales bacterium]HRA31939.1 haloacid dehalogenase type II [Thermomicrobiales bacterium]